MVVFDDIGDVRSFVLDGDLNVFLVQDTLNYLEVVGGENSIDFVQYEKNDDELRLFNESKCNWLRNYEREVKVNFHFKDIREIRNLSVGVIDYVEPLKLDSLSIHQNGTGDIRIAVNGADRIWVDTYVIGDVELTGDTKSLIATVGSFGNLKAKSLEAGWVSVEVTNEGDAYVNPVNAMSATCTQLGDVYYYNDIVQLEITESEEGKVELVLE